MGRDKRISEFQLPLPLDATLLPELPADLNLYPTAQNLITEIETVEPGLDRFVTKVEENLVVRTPSDAGHFLLREVFNPFEAFEQEELYVLMLNMKNRVTHVAMIYRGTVNSIFVREAEVLRPAVRLNATSILIAHNHPSGLPEPSAEDVRFSEALFHAGRLLKIELIDHLIIGDGSWVSLRERRLGFE